MKPDAKFIVNKNIPLVEEKVISKGTLITRTHGVYYMEGGMLPPAYQNDFDTLIEHEVEHGWNYLYPVVEKIAFRNKFSDK